MALSAVIGSVRVNLAIDAAQFRDGLKGASKSLDRLGKRMQRAGQTLSTALTAPLTIIGGLSLKAFADFDKGLIGVSKTTGVAGKELERLGKGVEDIASRVPVATTRLLAMTQVSGQLGVRGNANLLKFTETIGKLDLATSDFSGEEAASSLARILNLTQTGVDEVDRLASAFVRAGNDFNATEGEINAVALRVAQATTAFNVSASEVVGIATALREAGIEAERGGTAMQKTFFKMDAAARRGGESLEIFSRLTNRTTEEFSKLAREAPAKAFEEFINGLKRVQRAGGDLAVILEALELSEIRTTQSLISLASTQKSISDILQSINQGYEENRDLNEEAARATEAFSAQVQLTRTAVEQAARSLGRTMAPAANRVLTIIREVAGAFSNLRPEVQRTIAIIGGIAAAIGPGLIALGLLTRGLVMGGAAVVAFGSTFAAFGRLFATVVRNILASIGLLIGATSGMVGAFIAATAAILTAWAAFGNTIITVAGEIVMGIRDWFVTKFNSLVVVPFTKLLNQQIMGIPRLIREALGLEPIPLPLDATVDTASLSAQVEALDQQLDKVQAKLLVETDPQALAELNAQGEALISQIQAIESVGVDAGARISNAFQGDLDRIKAKFDELVAGIKSTLPEGLVNAVVGDANDEEVIQQVETLNKLKADLDDLLSEDFSDLSGGGAGKKGAKTKTEIDQVADSLRSMAVEAAALRGEFGTLGPETVSLLDNLGLLNVALQDGQVASFQLAEGSNAVVTAMERLQDAREVADIQDSVKTATERLNEQLARLRTLYEQGAISADTFQRAQELVKARFSEMDDAIQSTARGALGNLTDTLRSGETGWKQYAKVALDALNRITDTLLNQVLDALFQVNQASTGGSSGGGFLSGLLGLFGGAAGATASSGSFGAGSAGAGTFFALPSAKGNVFQRGSITPFAKGDIVGKPTFFPMAKGEIGLMGEAGKEAIMPLARAVKGGLGVQAFSDKGGEPVVLPLTRGPGGDLGVNLGALMKEVIPIQATASEGFAKGAAFDAGRIISFARGGVAGQSSHARTDLLQASGERGGGGNVYNIDARGADMAAVQRLERSLMELAGPGKFEKRVEGTMAKLQGRGHRYGRGL